MNARRRELPFRTLGALAGVILVFAALLVWLAHEPSLEGRSIRSWVADLTRDRDGSHERAVQFFTRNGRKTVPGLMGVIESKTPKSAHWVRGLSHFDRLPSGLQEWVIERAEIQPMHRIWAVEMCSLLGPEAREAQRTLLAVRADPEAGVRASVAKALAKVRVDPALAIPVLVEMLGDPSPYVRAKAAVALGMYGEAARSAVPNLRKAVEDADSGAALSARIGLALIETPERVELLGDDRYRLRP